MFVLLVFFFFFFFLLLFCVCAALRNSNWSISRDFLKVSVPDRTLAIVGAYFDRTINLLKTYCLTTHTY